MELINGQPLSLLCVALFISIFFFDVSNTGGALTTVTAVTVPELRR